MANTHLNLPLKPSRRSFSLAWVLGMLLILGFEGPRWFSPEGRLAALSGWLCGEEADWLPFLPIFLAGIGLLRRPVGPAVRVEPTKGKPTGTSDLGLSLALGLFGVAVVAWTGWEQRNLPPAYHDEYSYLFQSETFLDGRTSYPCFETMPQLFDQMHVLNEGQFASRYFPGAGAWFALFIRWHPVYGQWLAQGIVVGGMSIVAGELSGRTARVVAGLAAALCPGLCLFSQLLLAHHPTLIGLTLFLVEFLCLKRHVDEGTARTRRAKIAAILAGLGLSYAMLCRPMTAAGVGLPFGAWLLWSTFFATPKRTSGSPLPTGEGLGVRAESQTDVRNQSRFGLIPHLVLIGLPLVAGIAVQLVYNHSITGQYSTSPYQLYTDLYTPRHVYGFNNVTRGEQHLGPKVLDNYDRWAENLTLPLALKKMGLRVVASGRWTMGLVPLAFVVVWLLCGWRRWPSGLWLVLASIVSLHVVHLPYWFEGIMGWHYVFESAPLWAVVLGVVTADIFRSARESRQSALRWWWVGVLSISLATSWLTVTPLWRGRMPVGLAELRYPRQKYQQFQQLLDSTMEGPAIVFIRSDPADRHFDLVTNGSRLDAEILRARAPSNPAEMERAMALFPNRSKWIYNAASGELRRLTP